MGKKERTDKEKRNILISKVMEVLRDTAQQRMPEEGLFQKFFVTFDYPGTPHKGFLWIEPNRTGRGGNGRVTAAVCQGGSDRMVQHYIAVGSKAELTAWLDSAENLPLLLEEYEQLNRAADRLD